MGIVQQTIDKLKEKRKRAIDGKINCIPSPFKRFSSDFVGLEKSTYLTVTSFTKGAKSQFTSYTFIYEPLLYAYYNNPDIKLTYIYFPLEESYERIIERFMSFLVYRLSKGKYRISPANLRSVDSSKPVPKEVLEIIESDEVMSILKYFEEHVIFSQEANPTGIYKFCKAYAENNGKTYTKTIQIKNDFGQLTNCEVFDYYIPNNPEEYVIPIIDTINLVECERGLTQKQSMDKMSEYLAKYLRNRYGMSPIVIQQQAFSAEDNDSFKLGRTKPSVHSLGDSKYTARDSNITLGLNSPARFGIQEYFGYDIRRLNDNVRFLEVLVNRDGQMGGVVGLFFDGAVCTFSELPLPGDKIAMEKVYKHVKQINQRAEHVTLLMFSFIDKLKNVLKK